MIDDIRTIYAHRMSPCEREAIDEHTLLDDIDTDCLERAEIALAVEDHTGVQVPDAAIEKWLSVGDALRAAQPDLFDTATTAREVA